MHRIPVGLLSLLLAGCAAPMAQAPAPRTPEAAAALAGPADLVLRGGVVYTMDAGRSFAEAVAVRDGRIVFVGADRQLGPFVGTKTRVIELKGRMLLPGFIDTHIHPRGGTGLADVKLEAVYDRKEVERIIRDWAKKHPERSWVVGRGWEVAAFRPSGQPTKQLLDELVPDRPAFLRASDGHTAWANSKALALAGITKDTPDPPNGIIGKDKKTGELTGVLFEEAQELVKAKVPKKTHDEWIEGQRLFMAELRKVGITSIMDAGTEDEPIAITEEMARNGEQTARTSICQYLEPTTNDDDKQIRHFEEVRARLSTQTVQAPCVKLMLDGILEQATAHLIEPYVGADAPKDKGPIFIEPKRLREIVTKLDARGFQVHIHAIGDGAVRESLNAYEAARRANGARDSRHLVAHVQLIDPADIPRFRELGAIATMTPIWGRGDELMHVYTVPRIGPRRGRWNYPHRTIMNLGSRLVWGSDWVVSSMNPMEGLETAVTRRHLGGKDPMGKVDQTFIPEETLTIEQALRGYTIDAAYALHVEKERGSIEVGKLADLAVLEKNLFTVPELELHAVKVDYTVLGGKIIYDRAVK